MLLFQLPGESQGARLSTVMDLTDIYPSPQNESYSKHTDAEDSNNNDCTTPQLDMCLQLNDNSIKINSNYVGFDDTCINSVNESHSSNVGLPRHAVHSTGHESVGEKVEPVTGWVVAPPCEQLLKDGKEIFYFDFMASPYERAHV